MKRNLDDTYDSEGQLREFKSTIKNKSQTILEKELKKLVPRSLNQENVSKYLSSQYALDRSNGDVLKTILESVQHIPASKMFEDIEKISSNLWDTLKAQQDKRFYIVLTGTGAAHCSQKSNMFLSILALCSNENLLENFEDFICRNVPLHWDKLSGDVTNYVYLDDASFSGTQMSTQITTLGGKLEREFPEKRFNMHIMILYPTNFAILKTPYADFPGDVSWYHTDITPIELQETLRSMDYKIYGEKIWKAAQAFTRDDIFDEGDEMSKSLFYTDLKIPDTVSVYPKFLLDPVLVDSDFNTHKFPHSIVSNCSLPVDSDDTYENTDLYKIENGTFCPMPTYKQQDWKENIKGLFPLF